MANITHAFAALSDPTRRAVFECLHGAPRSVGDIAARLPVSRPAVSQHLKVLKEAGLVTDTAEGTRRIYRIDPEGLGPLRMWLDQFWSTAIDRFAALADAEADAADPRADASLTPSTDPKTET